MPPGAQEDALVLDPARATALARALREAAELGDIMSVESIAEGLPRGSRYRIELERMADDFDLDGVQRLAQEIEKSANAAG